MKKTLFAVLASAALVMSLTSCDALFAALGAGKGESTKAKKWGSQKTEDVDLEGGCQIILEDDGDYKFDTSWFTITDFDGLCLDDQPTLGGDGKTITFTKKQREQKNANNANPRIESYVLYIHVKGPTGDEVNDGDVRGNITVYADKATKIKASKYGEKIAPVGLVTITNNEPVAASLYPNGDYTITEIWPLNPKKAEDKDGNAIDNAKVDGEYVVEDTMKFTGLKIAGQKYDATEKDYVGGGKVTFPVKAGKQIIGLYQPNRNKKVAGADELGYGGPTAAQIQATGYADLDGDGVKEASRAEALKIDLTKCKTDDDIIEAYKKANDKLVFGYDVNVSAHKTKPIDSSVFGTYWFVKESMKMIRYKTVEDTYEETYDVICAPMAK